jgi:hypothetical protein
MKIGGCAVKSPQSRSSKEVSVEEAARILGLPPNKMLNLLDSRRVKSRKLRRQILVDYSSIVEFFNDREERNRIYGIERVGKQDERALPI